MTIPNPCGRDVLNWTSPNVRVDDVCVAVDEGAIVVSELVIWTNTGSNYMTGEAETSDVNGGNFRVIAAQWPADEE